MVCIRVMHSLFGYDGVRTSTFAPVVRTSDTADRNSETFGGQSTLPGPHVDWLGSGLSEASKHEIEARSSRRFFSQRRPVLILNTWRCLQPSRKSPLILLDRASTHTTPRVDVKERGLTFHLPDDKWFYLSNMQADDVLVFLQYDYATQRQDQGRIVHCAGHHPVFDSATSTEPARYSLETRHVVRLSGLIAMSCQCSRCS